mmetsp:Transcript_27302/g.66242  ORF Transcript_27302/g.66242 Transcript_27302/m.66242 type:complete len:154 (+) Transcript_27302:200-661(+)
MVRKAEDGKMKPKTAPRKTVEKKKKPVVQAKKNKPAAVKKPTAAKRNKTVQAKKKPIVAKKKMKPVAGKMKATKPAAPKKSVSGFIKFRQEHQAKVKEENPNDSAGQIGKKLGDMWRALSKEEKAAYKPAKAVVAKPIAPAAVKSTIPAILAA